MTEPTKSGFTLPPDTRRTATVVSSGLGQPDHGERQDWCDLLVKVGFGDEKPAKLSPVLGEAEAAARAAPAAPAGVTVTRGFATPPKGRRKWRGWPERDRQW